MRVLRQIRCHSAVTRVALLTSGLACGLLVASCDGGDAAARSVQASSSDVLTERELDDGTRAIETYIAANRTREAEIIARKLIEAAAVSETPASKACRAEEYAARAFFARAELAKAELSFAERDALVKEAQLHAARAAAMGASLEVTRFAAMLADRVGDHAQAQALYASALERSPQDGATLLSAAMSALAVDAHATRVTDYAARYSTVAPDAAWSEGLHAEIALARGEKREALEHAFTANKRDSEALEFRIILAKALRANDRASDAARMLSALPTLDRARPAVAQQYALALAETKDFDAAAAAWDAALTANPEDAYIRAEAALGFSRAHNTARAAAELHSLSLLYGGERQRARIEPQLAQLARE